MPALQRTEARTRARLLQVHGYRIDLDLTRGETVFGCTTVIRFGSAEAGAATFLDLRPQTLRRAVLNGTELDPAALDGNRLPLTGLLAENELLLETDQNYSSTGEGLHRYTDPADGEVYLYATCGPDLAPLVFPCFDQPDLKAPLAIAATAPAGWTVLGNGAGKQVAEGRWEFEPTLPISTYLFTVVAGPLHSVYSEHDGIPLGLHGRRALAADLDREAVELFEVTRASFDRLHELFDQRYPFGRYDQAFVPEFNWGAMENPGCVVFAEEMLFHSAPTEAERAGRAMVVAHEMAHMWFGDLVTLRWWDDIWLNESFAEYLGFRVAAEATRFTNSWSGFAVKRKGWGYDADQRVTTHPIAANGLESVAEAMSNFDGISYAKGAAALRQLVAWLGDEAFFAGINEHFARHRFGNAELAEFLDVLAESSGRDVHGWAESWLRTSGVDTLRVQVAYQDGGERIASAELVPTGSRPHLVGLGVFDLADDGRPVLRESFEVEVGPGRPTALPQLAGAPAPALLLPNFGDLSWAKVRLDQTSWRTVAAALSRFEDPLTRAVLWEHARDLTRDGELPPSAYLDLVAAHLPGEPVDAIVEAVLTFGRLRLLPYLAPAERPAAEARLASAARELLARPEADQGLRQAALKSAVENASGPEQLAELEQWLAEGAYGQELSAALRWAALLRLTVHGVIGAERIAVELAADPGVTATEGAARARAALSGAEDKERAWQSLFDPASGLSNAQLTATAQGFWQSGSEQLQDAYLERYFAEIPAAGGRGDIVARSLGSHLFPAGRSTPEAVALAERTLAEGELTPVLRRVLADQLDDLARAARIRG
ncbi:aminopeptidase N [Kitasatospora sp. NPDC002040]|uniref:aminopeptidase N n=1 Tax=Kitasatospora sp. NPDC002040 TaxID=3154661 RepID=UPI003326411D